MKINKGDCMLLLRTMNETSIRVLELANAGYPETGFRSDFDLRVQLHYLKGVVDKLLTEREESKP